MARPLRIEYPGAWYHIMNSGARRRRIFRTDEQRAIFLELLAEATQIYHLQTHAYCLLGSRYHLLVHTPAGHLGRALCHLNGVYTQRFNRLTSSTGPLFHSRYKSILVDHSYLLRVSRYIHLRPVKARIVRKAWEHQWSSYPAYIGRATAPSWLDTGILMGLTGKGDSAAVYQRFVEQGVEKELAYFYASKRQQTVLGSDAFRSRVTQFWPGRFADTEIRAGGHMNRRLDMKKIIGVTAQVFSVPVAAIYRSTRGRGNGNLPRLVAMACVRKLGAYDLSEIAREFGVTHCSTISAAVKRVSNRAEADENLNKMINKISVMLS